MSLKKLKKAISRVDKAEAEMKFAIKEIAVEIRKHTNAESITVGELAGDGLGVFLGIEDAAAPLNLVLQVIEKKGTITEDELAKLAWL